jgi:hypothetical protein
MSDDELVRRYLLGDLPGDEQEALVARLLAEDDLFELAEAMEAEVLDDYARGDLNPGQRKRVDRYLKASEEGRLRLAVVRGVAVAPEPVGRILPIRPVLPTADKLRALAAMLVIAVGALLLARVTPTPIQEKHPGDAGLVAENTPPPAPTPVPQPPPPPIVFVATIALSNLRGAAQIPSFDISSGRTDIFELRLTLPAGDEGYPSYQVVLNDAAEQEVATKKDLHADPSRQLALRMDADQLPAGRYSLTVQGVTPQGEVEDLAYPEFEVHEP